MVTKHAVLVEAPLQGGQGGVAQLGQLRERALVALHPDLHRAEHRGRDAPGGHDDVEAVGVVAAPLEVRDDGVGEVRLDPTQVPVYVTDNVLLYDKRDLSDCCIIGFHGASEVNGQGTGSGHGNGNQTVQTFIWSSYLRPGVFFTTDDPSDMSGGHYLQDVHPLSHEVSEWMDDPFVNNKVEPWLTPTAPQYGCTDVLETGDPVVGIGFHQGTNPFFQATAYGADGFWHPEDEVFLSWFAREVPSRAIDGNYTFMGPANPFEGFHQPATGC